MWFERAQAAGVDVTADLASLPTDDVPPDVTTGTDVAAA